MNILSADEKRARKGEARRRLTEAILSGGAVPAKQRQEIEDAAGHMAAVCAEDALDDALITDTLFEEMCFMDFDWVFEKSVEKRMTGTRKTAAALRRAILYQADVRV